MAGGPVAFLDYIRLHAMNEWFTKYMAYKFCCGNGVK